VVCVDGGAEALRISAAYNYFLRRPTGPVEAAFGHRTFRLDVSAPIAGGASWQLGVYAAHALYAAGRLTLDAAAAPDTPALLATGQVNRWGRTGSIDYLDQKLRAAWTWLADLRAQGADCTVAYPSADAEQLPPELRAAFEDLGVRLLACEDVNDLERALDLTPASLADDAPPVAGLAASTPAAGTPSPPADTADGPAVSQDGPASAPAPAARPPVRGRRRRRWLGAATVGGALLAAAVGWPLWQALPLVQAARAGDYAALAGGAQGDWRTCPGCALFRVWADGRQPPPDSLELSATAFHPSDRRTCDQARWSGGRLEARRTVLNAGDAPARLSGTRLCELRYDLSNRGERAVPAVLALLDAQGQTLASTGQAALRPGERIELFVDPGRLRAAEGPFRLVAYASGFAPGNLRRALTPVLQTGRDAGASPVLAPALALSRVSGRHELQGRSPVEAPAASSTRPSAERPAPAPEETPAETPAEARETRPQPRFQ
jgi:hypothetical protein